MALSRDFAYKMLFWAVIVVSILLALGCFTPRENRVSQKNVSPEWSAVTGGTSRDKHITASPKKAQSRPVASSRSSVVADHKINSQAVADIRTRYGHIIKEASAVSGVHPIVITAIIYEESKGDPTAVSPRNCKGLTQICDSTAQEYGVRNVFDPRENILGGTKILASYRQKVGGSFDRALVAYNAGPYSDLLNDPNFDPARYEYVRRVRRTIAYLSA